MTYIIIAFIVVCAVVSFIRLRQGGPGPAVNYVPRAFRGRLNSTYERAGWQRPFDDEGNRSRDRSQI
jgi:hypothetical protein